MTCRAARDAGPKSRVGRIRQPTDHLQDSGAHLGIEIVQKLALLLDQILSDARVQPLPLPRDVQCGRASVAHIRALCDVPLSNQRADDPTGRAFVEEQAFCKRVEPHRSVQDKGLERVALRHRNVVAADAVAVTELIHANEIGHGLLQRDRVAIESRARRTACVRSSQHACQ